MNRSLHIITVLGIPIEINYSWFIIFFLVTWTLAKNYFPIALPHSSPLVYWIISIIAAIFFFLSLLAHELSHSIVAVKNKLPISGITLFVFGGVAHMTKEPETPGIEFKMAAAGPLCSFAISLLFFVLTQLLYSLKFPMAIVVATDYLSFINLMVGIFNLIPGFPLDGGRILRAALWSLFGDIKKATQIASSFGKGFAYFLMGMGFLYLVYGAALSGIWLIFIGFFLRDAASVSYQQVAFKKYLSGVKVRDIMTKNVVTVNGDLTLLSIVDDYFFKFRFTSIPVVTDDGEIKGIVTIHSVKDVPRSRWAATNVSEAMIPLKSDLVVTPRTDILDALAQMAGNGIGRLLVTQDGKLIGIISQRDVIRLFEVREDLEA
jgi:Zn-dependent protease/predicted transcriptional regulator